MKLCHPDRSPPGRTRWRDLLLQNAVILSEAKDLCISSHVRHTTCLPAQWRTGDVRTRTISRTMGGIASKFCSLTETTTVTGLYRLPAPFRCSAPHSPPGWPVSQVQKDEYRIRFQQLKPMQSAVDCQRNWTAHTKAHYRRSPNFTRISRDGGRVNRNPLSAPTRADLNVDDEKPFSLFRLICDLNESTQFFA
jgi:hypothetical protein